MSQFKQVMSTVISNNEVLPGVYLLWAEAPEIAALARPGQYVMVRCGEGHEMILRRPLSIHQIYQDRSIGFLFAVVGRGTEWLAQRIEGNPIDLFGPLGNGFYIYDSSRNLLLVAGGVGIAPLLALAEHAIAVGRSVKLLIGNRNASQIYPDRLIPPDIETVIITEDGSLGRKGMATDILPEFIDGVDQVFACGPLPMYRAMAEMSGRLGDKPTQVLLETVMGCGVGACLSCTIETRHGRRQVCKDGPVFELNDIIWDKIAAPPCGRRC
jgi:dihydroorotate dehydrogenase electron transfer subunit